LPTSHRPEWQLPRGVPRGVWQYTQADHIADQYDDYFATNRLFEFDEQVVARHFIEPGLVIVHVHNFWFNLFDPAGRRWLLRHLPAVFLRRDIERGDKFFDYRGIPRMFLHTFTRGELVRALRRAGFRIEELIPLHAGRQRPLPHPWWFGRLRANGWIAVCRHPQ